ncbi:MAG: hypothetical protein M4579_002902 [Chaenotheca gracillima]|nr:MAG: hypothetical protein M4579_002902 [Chaenotheca gracillima]
MSATFEDDLLQRYSDDDLKRFILESPRVESMSRVFILSPNFLGKHYNPDEVEDALRAMDTARQLGIRVPCVRRTVMYKSDAYCVMERIPGIVLEEAWMRLSWVSTMKLAFQLKRFVKLLRSVTASSAGSLATGKCRSFWLEDRFGIPARSSPEIITSFVQFWVDFVSIRKAMKAATEGTGLPKGRVPPTPKSLVFVHHDLAPRNILLDPWGQLWLLDWDYAGFYPRYFEYAAMQNFTQPEEWTRSARLRWFLFTWVGVGRAERAAKILDGIRSKFTRSPVGRRFEILENGAPSGRAVS